MLRRVLHSKIHRATVTHANVDYEGSISLPSLLLDAADMKEFEAVWVWNVTNGNRFETYTIRSQTNDTDIAVNGAAAHLVSPGDIIIIAAFSYYDSSELVNYKPKAIFVDKDNRIRELREEVPGPLFHRV